MSQPEEVTAVRTPNAIQLLETTRQLLSQALETQQDARNKLVECMRLIEEVQGMLRHGIAAKVAPLERRVEELESRVTELEKVA